MGLRCTCARILRTLNLSRAPSADPTVIQPKLGYLSSANCVPSDPNPGPASQLEGCGVYERKDRGDAYFKKAFGVDPRPCFEPWCSSLP